MAGVSREAVRDEIVRAAHRGLDVRGFSLAATRALRRLVAFDGVCVLTMDPATTMPTGNVVENGLPLPDMARMAEFEMIVPDFIKFRHLARAAVPASSLSAATGGVLDRSVRHRELKAPNGLGDELRVALVDEAGAWGAITLLRETGRAFEPGDAETVASLSRPLLEGLRRAVLLFEPSATQEGEAGLLLLRDDDSIDAADAAAETWLDEMGGDPLPVAIRAVASRARAAAAGDSSGDAPASARLRTPAGRWVLVRGSLLGERTAVIVEPVRAHELAPLISDAYGLTPRERDITSLVAQGHSTDAIGARLHVSPWTVQDHLKTIFEKVGVNSRGALVARLFFEHYAPRLTASV